jgi:hypothetical protein
MCLPHATGPSSSATGILSLSVSVTQACHVNRIYEGHLGLQGYNPDRLDPGVCPLKKRPSAKMIFLPEPGHAMSAVVTAPLAGNKQ